MEIKLELSGDQRLRATMRNNSAEERAVLHSDLQPSRLELLDAAGHKLAPFDERTRMKFDRTIRASQFSRVAPNGELVVENAVIRKVAPGEYELRWGPFTYREIRPGQWKACVVFEAKILASSDGKSVKGAWSGKAVSNWVEWKLD